MVWKKLITCIALAVFLAVPMTASAVNIYEGNISSSYTTIFKDIASKEVGIFDDYVFYRSGQYQYSLVVGDLTFENGTFTSEGDVSIFLIDTESSNYNSVYTYSVTTDSGFNLDTGSHLLYSNLGHYPDLIERNNYYEIATLVLLLACVCMYLLRSIFGFSLRLYR